MESSASSGTSVKIKFVSEIREGARKENVAFDTNGLYYIKGNNTYLRFEEPAQNNQVVKTVVKIADDEVTLLRSGAVSMRQKFRKHETTFGTYESVVGSFEMQTDTSALEYEWRPKVRKGKLFLSYMLNLQGSHSSRHSITIQFKEE